MEEGRKRRYRNVQIGLDSVKRLRRRRVDDVNDSKGGIELGRTGWVQGVGAKLKGKGKKEHTEMRYS
jgi:hypothetical protein